MSRGPRLPASRVAGVLVEADYHMKLIGMGLADGVTHERQVFHSLFATDDQKEGMDAFVNKRKPAFKNA